MVKLLDVAEVVVCKAAPPLDTLYQRKVPEVDDVAVSRITPLPQRDWSAAVGAVGGVLTCAVVAVRLVLVHVPLEKST